MVERPQFVRRIYAKEAEIVQGRQGAAQQVQGALATERDALARDRDTFGTERDHSCSRT